MVREALSNVRRHTRAARAAVALRSSAGRLVLEVSNDTRGEQVAPFRPRSIAERVEELGGRLDIFSAANGDTVVRIDVPR
jgi:signal transduction histidine kinase